jgi:nicotinamide riboside kinase
MTAQRIVVVGAESTGTTTLTSDLCEHFQGRGGDFASTAWVPEFGRDYTVRKLRDAQVHRPDATMDDLVWTDQDFVDIAREQNFLEDQAAELSGRILLCDTDAFATALWQERYLGRSSSEVWSLAFASPRILYILTTPVGVRFDADEIRDGESLREWMTDRFREELERRATPWVELDGVRRSTRLELAIDAIDRVLAN